MGALTEGGGAEDDGGRGSWWRGGGKGRRSQGDRGAKDRRSARLRLHRGPQGGAVRCALRRSLQLLHQVAAPRERGLLGRLREAQGVHDREPRPVPRLRGRFQAQGKGVVGTPVLLLFDVNTSSVCF